MWCDTLNGCACISFGIRIGETVQKGNRNRLDPVGCQLACQSLDESHIKLLPSCAISQCALRHIKTQITWHQRLRHLKQQIIELVAILSSNFNRVAKSLSSQQSRRRT